MKTVRKALRHVVPERELDLVLNSIPAKADSYKIGGHWKQTPEDMINAYTYYSSRGTRLNWENPRIMFFGIQMFLRENFRKPITHEQIDAMKPLALKHMGEFNEEGWRYIVDQYDGVLPLRIRAPKEGTVMPLQNVMMTIEATDPKCYWLPPYIETMGVRALWYASTVATNSFRAKELILKSLHKTADDPEAEAPFKLHDFGARGVSSYESANIGGTAHMVNFAGTDTFSATVYAMKHYFCDMLAFSIPASEHFTMTSWGRLHEYDAFKNMLDEFGGPGKMVACVSDSYNIYDACTEGWGGRLKDQVMNMGGTLVVRPDSGDPLSVPLEVIELLMESFGHTVNSKGYRVLPDYIRVIQGDGITVDNIAEILRRMEEAGLSASNIAFGMGGGLLQQCDRDTYQFAQKCSAAQRSNGDWYDVSKDPVGDKGKKSLKGRVTLVKNVKTGEFRTIRVTDAITSDEINMMRTVYNNGIMEDAFQSLDEIRVESEKYLDIT